MFSTELERAVATFRARSSERDAEFDEKRVSSIEMSIDAVVLELVAERAGLVARLKRVLQEPERIARWGFTRSQRPSSSEFIRVEERLNLLELQLTECGHLKQTISHLRTLIDFGAPKIRTTLRQK